MKRLLVFLTITCLTACSSAPSEKAIQTALAGTMAAIPTSTAWPTYTPYPTSTAQPTFTPYPTDTPKPTPTSTVTPLKPTHTPLKPTDTPKPQMGTRNMPYPIGEASQLTMSGNIQFTLTIKEVLRGDEALSKIQEANPSNNPPPSGFEFVLILAEVNYNGNDGGLLTIEKDFFSTITSSRLINYTQTTGYTPCCLEPDFSFSLFHGGVAEGWIALPVYTNDASPLLVIGILSNGTGGVFFSLTP